MISLSLSLSLLLVKRCPPKRRKKEKHLFFTLYLNVSCRSSLLNNCGNWSLRLFLWLHWSKSFSLFSWWSFMRFTEAGFLDRTWKKLSDQTMWLEFDKASSLRSFCVVDLTTSSLSLSSLAWKISPFYFVPVLSGDQRQGLTETWHPKKVFGEDYFLPASTCHSLMLALQGSLESKQIQKNLRYLSVSLSLSLLKGKGISDFAP